MIAWTHEHLFPTPGSDGMLLNLIAKLDLAVFQSSHLPYFSAHRCEPIHFLSTPVIKGEYQAVGMLNLPLTFFVAREEGSPDISMFSCFFCERDFFLLLARGKNLRAGVMPGWKRRFTMIWPNHVLIETESFWLQDWSCVAEKVLVLAMAMATSGPLSDPATVVFWNRTHELGIMNLTALVSELDVRNVLVHQNLGLSLRCPTKKILGVFLTPLAVHLLPAFILLPPVAAMSCRMVPRFQVMLLLLSLWEECLFFFFFFYEWEHRTGTMCPFSSLHPLRKGKEV